MLSRRYGRADIAVKITLLSFFIVFFCSSDCLARAILGRETACPNLVDLVQEVSPSVVNISIEKHILEPAEGKRHLSGDRRHFIKGRGNKSCNSEPLDSLASGFVFNESGLIVTNAHVVEGASRILVKLSSGKICLAKVVKIHPKMDLALLKIKPPHSLTRAHLGDSSDIKVGQWVLAIGNPFGLGTSVSQGIVSGTSRFIHVGASDLIQTDASINPGNSGGPLFNMAGEVIGVNTLVMVTGKGIGFSIPSKYVMELVNLPSQRRHVFRGWLGVYVSDMTTNQARTLGMSEPRGTFVDEVLQASPAYKAGLRVRDLVVDAGGKQIRNGRHLARIVANSQPGDRIRMNIIRAGKPRTLEVIIGEAPQ